MSLKIVNISTLCRGGAGIAAYRLHQALLKSNKIESIFIQKFEEQNTIREENLFTCYPTQLTIYERLKRKFKLDSDNRYWSLLKDNLPDNNVEALSTPVSLHRIEKLDIVQAADIIHLHSVTKFLNYSTFFKNIKQPIIWTLHDMNPFMGIFHYEGDFHRNIDRLGKLEKEVIKDKISVLHKKDNLHIVCLSEWMKKKSEASAIFRKYPHYLIPNGLDFSYYPLLDKEECRREMGITNNLKTIFFIASDINIKRKGFDLFMEVIAKMDNLPFNFISVGGEKIELDSSINHIHFNRIDDVSKLNVIYSAADLTLLLSREDNLPNVMLESFANGTPILCFKTGGGMAEHINEGQNGILTETMNNESFANDLKDFVNGKYEFDRNQIRTYAVNHFSDSIQAEKYIDLYYNIKNSY